MNIPLLFEIDQALAEITEQELQRSFRMLEPWVDGEAVLGHIYAIETQRLWALCMKCNGKYAELKTKATFQTDSDDEKKQMDQQAERWNDLSSACRVLFWIQAKDDIGDAAWSADVAGKTIGVRTEFKVVIAKSREDPLSAILKRSLGGPSEP